MSQNRRTLGRTLLTGTNLLFTSKHVTKTRQLKISLNLQIFQNWDPFQIQDLKILSNFSASSSSPNLNLTQFMLVQKQGRKPCPDCRSRDLLTNAPNESSPNLNLTDRWQNKVAAQRQLGDLVASTTIAAAQRGLDGYDHANGYDHDCCGWNNLEKKSKIQNNSGLFPIFPWI